MQEKQVRKERGRKIKGIPDLLKLAQKVFNAWIRNRDRDLPCISCGQYKELQAGHYVPQKNSSFLRFNEWNVNGECAGCNGFDAFHLIGYKKNLIKKIGIEKVLYLEQNQQTLKKWTREELTEIIEKYKNYV